MKRRARAVAFDLDGTLVDTLDDIAAALNHVLVELGRPTHEVAAYRQMIGDGARVLVERALPAADSGLVDQCLDRFRRRYADHLVIHTRVYPGISSLLDELEARRVPTAVVSNKPHGLTLEVARRLLGRWPWASVAGQREGSARKPDPAPALEAAARMGTAPDRCLFVGDSKVDMQTGRAAGMLTVGVSWGFRDRAELERHGAALVVDRPEELLPLLPSPVEMGV